MHIRSLGLGSCVLLSLLGCSGKSADPAKDQNAIEPPTENIPTKQRLTEPAPWAPNVDEGRFFSRSARSWDEGELTLEDYTLQIEARNGIATLTLDVSIGNPTKEQAEAILRLPIPPGAAVTSARLWVKDEPVRGVLLGNLKARDVFDQFVDRRRDPLLVSWGYSELLNISLFPVESKDTRRFSLTWVEPVGDDKVWVPSFHEAGARLGYPEQITVNGEPAKREDRWVTIPHTVPEVKGDFRLHVQQAVLPDKVAVILDTSRNPNDRTQVWKEFEQFVTAMDGSGIDVVVTAADWLLHDLGSGKVSSTFTEIHAAGLFDQDQALGWARSAVDESGVVAVFSEQMPVMSEASLSSDSPPVFWVGKHIGRYHDEAVGRTGGKGLRGVADLAKNLQRLSPPTDAEFTWLPLDTSTGHIAWLGRKRGSISPTTMSPEEALYHRATLRRKVLPFHKIVSPGTSILALESEKAYERWGIKNKEGELQSTGSDSDWGAIGSAGGTIGHGSGRDTRRIRASPGPKLRITKPTVSGSLDERIIRRYLRRKTPFVSRCLKGWSLHERKSATLLIVEFRVTPEGGVDQINAASSMPKDKEVEACVEGVLAGLSLPKPPDGDFVTTKYHLEVAPFPSPSSRWSQARKLLEADSPGFEKKIADLFGYRGIVDRTRLAWWLADNAMRDFATPSAAYLVVADLLRGTTSQIDKDAARRILSELAYGGDETVARIFEEWGEPEDAKRVRLRAQPARPRPNR